MILAEFNTWHPLKERKDMRGHIWQLAKPKPPPKPRVTDELREAVDVQTALVVAKLKKRFRRPKHPLLNWADDLFTRWHRDALYFVVVMRTPHGHPPTFEIHAARMDHAGDGKFNLAVPMRRGWNTFLRNASPEECLKEISQSVCF
jgi:hypothetical protein